MKYTNSTEFIDFWNTGYWALETVNNIVSKVSEYAEKKGLKDVKLVSVENNINSDPKNQRFDVVIQHLGETCHVQRKLLILKGEVIDGDEFHKRYKEFYE